MSEGVNAEQGGAKRQWLSMAALALLFLISLVVWGGLPPEEERPLFFAGVAVVIVVLAAIGLAAWHLLVRPLPSGQKQSAGVPVAVWQRRLIAALAAIGGLNLVVGGFWDEVWHRMYGLPFGEDLFWRPHILIYSSFGITALLAFGGLLVLLRTGEGTLQQRFRANPVVGLLVIAGGMMLIVTPADPIWHGIYGEDISAWSLPHVLLLVSGSTSMLLAAAMQLTTLPVKPWRVIWRAPAAELGRKGLIPLALALMIQIGLQVLTTEWDAGSPIIFQRPDWLLPALLTGYATAVGVLANRATRLAGSAVVTGALALLIRLLLIQLFEYPEVKAYSWYCMLPPLLAIDALYIGRARQGLVPPGWLESAVIITAAVVFGTVPIINGLYAAPQISWDNMALPALVMVVTAAATAWASQFVGDFLASGSKQLDDGESAPRGLRLAPPIALLGVVAFIVVYVATAQPPI